MRWIAIMVTVLVLSLGCSSQQDTATNEKPLVDPDVGLIDTGKTDAISSYYTTVVASLDGFGGYTGTIDYPDYFHGVTIELTAGQSAVFGVKATAKGLFRVYGPSHRSWYGRPFFKGALHKGQTKSDGTNHLAEYTLDVAKSGVYLVVYGPKNVWQAKYTLSVNCAGASCGEPKCESDADCGSDEFCGHNGVVCIMAPCDVSFNICLPKGGVNATCFRSEMCQPGLPCINNKCTQFNNDQCKSDDDCTDGFCGYSEAMKRICKPWQKEGETCGGFVPAHLYKRCPSHLTCATPPMIADAPGVCAYPVTVAELQKDPKAYDGHIVAITGYVDHGFAICTKMACPPNTCCNSCGASLLLADSKGVQDGSQSLILRKSGKNLGCGGNDCTWQDNCDLELGYSWAIGKFSVGDYEQLFLDLERIDKLFYEP